MSTPDSRHLLNAVLKYYYERGGTIFLDADIINGQAKFTRKDAAAAYSTLLRDGHIEQVKFASDFPPFQVASITGQGRVFLENGGYRDHTTYLDRQLERAKNKPVLVWAYLILSGIALISWVFELVVQLLT